MKKTIAGHKRLSGVATIAVLVSLYMAASMLKPPPSKAFTLVEAPGAVFAPIVVFRGQKVRLCSNNLFGDGSVRLLFEFRSHNDASMVLLSKTSDLGPLIGDCLESDVADLPGEGSTKGVIAIIRTTAGGNWAARSIAPSSLEVCPSDPAVVAAGMSCSSMLPAVQGQALRLPAVQRAP